MKIVAGNHVKLTEQFAAALMRRPQCRINWRARRGVVRVANSLHAWIMWPGLRTPEQLPHRVLELTDDAMIYEVPKKRRKKRRVV